MGGTKGIGQHEQCQDACWEMAKRAKADLAEVDSACTVLGVLMGKNPPSFSFCFARFFTHFYAISTCFIFFFLLFFLKEEIPVLLYREERKGEERDRTDCPLFPTST
jgi:hypothetical protein